MPPRRAARVSTRASKSTRRKPRPSGKCFGSLVLGDGGSGALGVKQIASRLNAEGHGARQGKPFRVQFIDAVLPNTAYVGEHYFNRNDSRRCKARPREERVLPPVPKIIDEALFYAAPCSQRGLADGGRRMRPMRRTAGQTLRKARDLTL